MNILDLFVGLYGVLHNRSFVPSRLISPFRFTVRNLANSILPFVLSKSYNKKRKNQQEHQKKIIVSLTSFPGRIESVWMVIECMLRQSLLPDRIILWLSKNQFPDEKVPNSLLSRVGKIFQIRFVANDYRSHKKYIYAFEEFKDDIVITIDDDIFYPTTLVESLFKAYNSNPRSVICCYGKKFYQQNGALAHYSSWKDCFDLDSKEIFFGSGGGSLFVPADLYGDVLNIRLAMELCPYADDVWLNAMTRLANVKVVLITRRLILPILEKSEIKLSSINVNQNLNDVQINKVCTYYKRMIFEG